MSPRTKTPRSTLGATLGPWRAALPLLIVCLALRAADAAPLTDRLAATLSVSGPALAPKPSAVKLTEIYRTLPLQFEANHGQTDPSVKFLARGRGYTLFLMQTEAVLVLRHHAAGTAAAKVRGHGDAEVGGPVDAQRPGGAAELESPKTA